jgi:hypothetical protein
MATSTLASVAGGSSGGGGDGSALPVAVGAGVGGLLLLVALVLLIVVLARRRARAKTLRALASAQQPRPANTAVQSGGKDIYAQVRKPAREANSASVHDYSLYANPTAGPSGYEAPQSGSAAYYDNPLFTPAGGAFTSEASFYSIGGVISLGGQEGAYVMPSSGDTYAVAGPDGMYTIAGPPNASDMAYERAVPYSTGTDYASPSDYQTPMFVGGQSAGPASSRGTGADGAPQYELAVSGQHYYAVPGAVGTCAQPESAQGGAPWVQLQGYEMPAAAASAYEQPAGSGAMLYEEPKTAGMQTYAFAEDDSVADA